MEEMKMEEMKMEEMKMVNNNEEKFVLQIVN
jgi:hypothetical protein